MKKNEELMPFKGRIRLEKKVDDEHKEGDHGSRL
jgi:hypothetical protein